MTNPPNNHTRSPKLRKRQAKFVEEYLAAGDCRAMDLDIEPLARWYVYFLADPRSGAIFYVGKGSGQRMHMHQKRLASEANHRKAARIERILAEGQELLCRVFESFDDEGEAYSCERELIAALRDHGLTNIAGGIMTEAERAIAEAAVMKRDLESRISKILPMGTWLNRLSDEMRDRLTRVSGSPEAFYSFLLETHQTLLARCNRVCEAE